MAFVNSASAVSPDFRMVGIAMHQDTGRNIYLGAVHQGKNIPNPDDLSLIAAPKIMEYRVVARRTSIRSLLGNMLLQSEVANGHPPGDATGRFADQLLGAVKGSLYSGDSFEVMLDANQQISAILNGVTLVKVDDGGTFDFLLKGWISENGPSTAFRSSITRTDLDGTLLTVYEAHAPSEERLEAISSWETPAAATATVAAVSAPVIETPAPAPVVGESPVETPAETVEEPPTAALAEVATAGAAIATTAAIASPVPAPDPVNGPMDVEAQIAEVEAIEPQENTTVEEVAAVAEIVTAEPALQDEIAALNVTEYSYRLAGFNTEVMKLVYSKIQYPRRAVRREIQGALELDITMQADGSVVDIEIAESSGYSILDGAAIEAAEKAFKNTTLGAVDPVAIAEYSNGAGDNLVVPVPVKFFLQ